MGSRGMEGFHGVGQGCAQIVVLAVCLRALFAQRGQSRPILAAAEHGFKRVVVGDGRASFSARKRSARVRSAAMRVAKSPSATAEFKALCASSAQCNASGRSKSVFAVRARVASWAAISPRTSATRGSSAQMADRLLANLSSRASASLASDQSVLSSGPERAW